MKNRKVFAHFIFGIFLVLMFWVNVNKDTKTAEAATQYRQVSYDSSDSSKVKAGGKYFWWSSKGNADKLMVSDSRYGKGKCIKKFKSFTELVTNGKVIYYIKYKTGLSAPLRRMKADGTGDVLIDTISNLEGISGGYGNCLFLEILDGEDEAESPIDTYQYNIKTGSKKRIMVNCEFTDSYQSYFVGKERGYGAYMGGQPLYFYDAKTGKIRRLSKTAEASCIEKTKIYYVDSSLKNSNKTRKKMNVKCYDIKSGKTKIIVKGLVIEDAPSEITSKSVIYSRNGYQYKYIFSTKKEIKVG